MKEMLRNSLLVGSALLAALPVAAQAQDITPSISGSVSRGDFGSDRDTRMGNVSIGARWSSDDTTVQVNLPYVVIDSPGVVFAGFDGTPLVMIPDAGGDSFSRDGFGDPTVSVSHRLDAGSFDFTGTARMKVPVQDYNDISTGEFDWSISGEVSKEVGGVVPFVSVGYRWFGDPELWEIEDGFSASAGVGAPVGGGAAAISYEFAESTSPFMDDAHEIVAVYDAPISDRFRLASFGTLGLSDGAPDFGVGIRLAASF
ncbi:hypothetical protein [uncultured Salinicola sp.]|uniref:hypothetical protein n=1 Tax=uncultured Salinicola sp. TaxID=1193542 RepID=UPI002613F647|nr:hypothetical protein [uncultured Salinicola sp.]|tara:strand:+ start:924 stop:1694 length:771 start_codon:yes stop_codon:yes gene_type:complete